MWNAFKSDLMDFVSTIQEDTTKTLKNVLGDSEDEEEEEDRSEIILEKLIEDAKRSYETYADDIKETHKKDYDRFFKRFSLIDSSTKIAAVLDQHDDVSRYYTELVPIKMSPETFWCKLFFKINLLEKSKRPGMEEEEEDEEDDLSWDHPAPPSSTSSIPKAESSSKVSSLTDQLRIKELEAENQKLNTKISSLISRIAELELQLKKKDSLPPAPTVSTPLSSPSISETKTLSQASPTSTSSSSVSSTAVAPPTAPRTSSLPVSHSRSSISQSDNDWDDLQSSSSNTRDENELSSASAAPSSSNRPSKFLDDFDEEDDEDLAWK